MYGGNRRKAIRVTKTGLGQRGLYPRKLLISLAYDLKSSLGNAGSWRAQLQFDEEIRTPANQIHSAYFTEQPYGRVLATATG